MATTVIDSTNMVDFLQGKPIEPAKEPEVAKAEAKDTPVSPEKEAAKPAETDEDGLTAEERKILGEKYDRVIGKRHRLQKEAEEARLEAEAFAEQTYREKRLAEKRADELATQLSQLQKPAPKPEDIEPQEADERYKDNPKLYWQEWAKWTARQEVKAEREAQAHREREAEAQRLDAARIERNKAFAKDHEDFAQVVEGLKEHDLTVPPYMAEYLLKSESSAAVMYHFANHPKEFETLVSKPPVLALEAVGRLVAKLEGEPAKEPPRVVTAERSKAPEPITPLNGASAPSPKDPREMTLQETIEDEFRLRREQFSSGRKKRH